jgi:broad specificity phosphatase PhoE
MKASSTRPDGGRGFLGLISQRGGQAAADAEHQGATRLWLVRHAPVAHGGRIYGQADFSCDCSETTLFTGLAEKLPRAAVWVTSNLRRTHETAAAIIRAGLPGPVPIPGPDAIEMVDLAEQDFGEWQGLTYEELQESRAGDFHRFWHAPAHQAAPGGESFVAVIARVSRAIHRLVDAYPGRDIIAVAHGGTIRAALALALGLDPEAALAFTIANCSITRIDQIDGPGMGHGWRVVTVNRPPR